MPPPHTFHDCLLRVPNSSAYDITFWTRVAPFRRSRIFYLVPMVEILDVFKTSENWSSKWLFSYRILLSLDEIIQHFPNSSSMFVDESEAEPFLLLLISIVFFIKYVILDDSKQLPRYAVQLSFKFSLLFFLNVQVCIFPFFAFSYRSPVRVASILGGQFLMSAASTLLFGIWGNQQIASSS